MAWTKDDGWVWVFVCVDHYTAEAWAQVVKIVGSLRWLAIADDPAYVGEPETNGCAKPWIKTLKEQCLWARLYVGIDELCQAVANFVETYNTEWLIQRHGHRTPREQYLASLTFEAAAS